MQSTRVEIHPLSSHNDLLSQSSLTGLDIKKVHFVRHAEGTHNVSNNYRCISSLDARLTSLGERQCADLAESLRTSSNSFVDNIQLVVTSPLTRCIQTALLCFPTLSENNKVPFIAHEAIRETVNFNADRRRPTHQLINEFPNVNFDALSENPDDPVWHAYEERLAGSKDYDSHRESAELHKVAERGRIFFKWLEERKEKEIVVCTHSAFLRCILSWGLPGGVPLMPPQHLDTRSDINEEIPVVNYNGDNEFESKMRSNYDNCELRSFLIVLKNSTEVPSLNGY